MREKVYVSERFLSEPENVKALSGISYEVLSDAVFAQASDTKTPQGILCLARQRTYQIEDLLKKTAHLLILESIQDPGNLGTMFRTGEGAGVTGIIMNRATVDVYNPKTVRATMGSIYRVPFFVAEDFAGTISEIKERKVALYAAHLRGSMSYDAPDYTLPCGFLVGNEGSGLSRETAKLADAYIRIPMEGKVESLNAAIAATLLMYEANRQRR